jgi:ubiquinol-cytochrome c reductase cytochrome b subunit
VAHILLLPVAIALLLGAHLTLVALRHHTQFRRVRAQTERRLVGEPRIPGQAPRALGLLIGALRLVPGFDLTVGDYTLVPNPFWGGALFPLVVFGILFLWPWAERRATGDRGWHNLLERPRDNPWRTAIGVAVVVWVLLVFMAGALDRSYVFFGITYSSQIWAFRVAVWVVPLVALYVTKRVCEELLAGERVERVRQQAERESQQDAVALP